MRQGPKQAHFCNHTNTKHRAENAKCNKFTTSSAQSSLCALIYPQETVSLHGLLQGVFLWLQSFYFAENSVMSCLSKSGSICCNTVVVYMSFPTKVGEKKIKTALLVRLATAFGVWSTGVTHYVTVFETFPASCIASFWHMLLVFSPMVWEDFYGEEMYNKIEETS